MTDAPATPDPLADAIDAATVAVCHLLWEREVTNAYRMEGDIHEIIAAKLRPAFAAVESEGDRLREAVRRADAFRAAVNELALGQTFAPGHHELVRLGYAADAAGAEYDRARAEVTLAAAAGGEAKAEGKA